MIGHAEGVRAAQAAAERLHMRVDVQVVEDWPLALARTTASAVLSDSDGGFRGDGAGTDQDEAVLRAVMECVERFAQFGCEAPLVEAAPFARVRERAIRPVSFGLYSRAQYGWPGFPCQPFAEDDTLEWVAVTDVLDQQAVLVPIEFIYPAATIGRRPLVCESSSGAAAHTDARSALAAGLCELVERDSLMLFWYRQPDTATLPLEEIPDDDIRDDLEALRGLGYVTTVAIIDYDLGIPCVAVFAVQGDDLLYGLGCHPDPHRALTRAAAEIGTALARLQLEPEGRRTYRSMSTVKTPDDHYRLYHRGPRHDFLRQVLAATLRGGDGAAGRFFGRSLPSGADAAETVIRALARHGYRAYSCDITPAPAREAGIIVLRTLVPGLIPLHFGFDRLRLGCERLVGTSSPGRLRHLLPHFVH